MLHLAQDKRINSFRHKRKDHQNVADRVTSMSGQSLQPAAPASRSPIDRAASLLGRVRYDSYRIANGESEKIDSARDSDNQDIVLPGKKTALIRVQGREDETERNGYHEYLTKPLPLCRARHRI